MLKLNLRQHSVAGPENNGQVHYRFSQEDQLGPQPHRQINLPTGRIKKSIVFLWSNTRS
jgi:hypothetical protein